MTSSHTDRPLRAVGLICTLKPEPEPSSSALLTEQIFAELHVADLFQALNDTRITIPRAGLHVLE